MKLTLKVDTTEAGSGSPKNLTPNQARRRRLKELASKVFPTEVGLVPSHYIRVGDIVDGGGIRGFVVGITKEQLYVVPDKVEVSKIESLIAFCDSHGKAKAKSKATKDKIVLRKYASKFLA